MTGPERDLILFIGTLLVAIGVWLMFPQQGRRGLRHQSLWGTVTLTGLFLLVLPMMVPTAPTTDSPTSAPAMVASPTEGRAATSPDIAAGTDVEPELAALNAPFSEVEPNARFWQALNRALRDEHFDAIYVEALNTLYFGEPPEVILNASAAELADELTFLLQNSYDYDRIGELASEQDVRRVQRIARDVYRRLPAPESRANAD